MGAVWMVVRAAARLRPARSAGLVVVVALVSGLVMAVVIGAHRTATSVERATVAFGGDYDAIVQQTGPPATERLRALPSVVEAEGITFAFTFPEGFAEEVNPFVGTPGNPYFRWLTEGRAPDPSVAGEFVANRGFLDLVGVEVGDEVPFRYLDDTELAGLVDNDSGSRITARLVGVVGGPGELENPAPTVVFSEAFLDLDVAFVATLTAVRLQDGITLDDLRREVEAIPGIDDRFLASGAIVSEAIRTSVRLQTTAVSLVAGLMAIAGVATVVQLLRRHRGGRESEIGVLRSLGLTWRQHVLAETGWAAGVVSAGVVIGVVVAVPLSLAFPLGFVRRLDPDTGSIVVAPWVVVVSAIAIGLAVSSCIAALVALDRHRRPRRAGRSAARRIPIGGAEAIGVRAVLAPSGRRSVPSLLAIGACFAGVVGGLLFWTSLGRLVDDSTRWGESWDYLVDSSFAERPIDVAAVADDPAVEAATTMVDVQAVVGDHDVELIGVDPVRGELMPVVLAGRVPEGDDEIALGRVTARTLGADLGDVIEVRVVEGGSARFTVVGEVVVPSPSFGQGAGRGAVLRFDGMRRVRPDVEPLYLGLRLAPGATLPERYAGAAQPDAGHDRPADVVNLGWLRPAPLVLVAVFALLAAVTLAHLLLTSVWSRRREHGVMVALGATAAWVRRDVLAQALTTAAVALAIAVPLGMLAGRTGFRALADHYGLVPEPAMPWAGLAATVVAAVAVAVAAALVAAGRRGPTVEVLAAPSE